MTTEHFQNPAMADNMHDRTDVEDWKRAFQRNLFYILGRFPATATANDNYLALAYSVRDHLLERWVKASETYYRKQARTVCYLSAEYLLGPHLGNNLLNLGALDAARQAMKDLGLDFESSSSRRTNRVLATAAWTAGRLLSRFTGDARSSVHRLRHPLRIRHLRPADPRRLASRDRRRVASARQSVGDAASRVSRSRCSAATPKRTPTKRPLPRAVAARSCDHGRCLRHPDARLSRRRPNLLRLLNAEAVNSFDFRAFNPGDYYNAVVDTVRSETISKVLYPNDTALRGKQLRLEQQYFLVSCALQDMICILPAKRGATFQIFTRDTRFSSTTRTLRSQSRS